MHKGLKIKLARISKGLTQEELAEKIDKTRPLVSSIEQSGQGNYYTIKKICEVLDLDIETLENELNEPAKGYNGLNANSLQKENNRLEKELQLYQELCESQKETILSLKAQVKLLQTQIHIKK
jgi:transcriptional regulator with XRE-family HTH domain